MLTNLFLVRGRRKEVRQPRAARVVLGGLGEGNQHSYAHNKRVCTNSSTHGTIVVHNVLSAIVMS